MKKRFTLSKKLVAVVRYYETMYLITDGGGERIYTGNDEKTAKMILGVLNRDSRRCSYAETKRKVRRK